MSKVTLNPPIIQPFGRSPVDQAVIGYLRQVSDRVGEGPFLIKGYDVNNLPDPAEWASLDSADPFSSIIFVYNETGGPVLAYSNATNWLRLDGTIVS